MKASTRMDHYHLFLNYTDLKTTKKWPFPGVAWDPVHANPGGNSQLLLHRQNSPHLPRSSHHKLRQRSKWPVWQNRCLVLFKPYVEQYWSCWCWHPKSPGSTKYNLNPIKLISGTHKDQADHQQHLRSHVRRWRWKLPLCVLNWQESISRWSRVAPWLNFFWGGPCNFNAWMIFGAFFGDGPFVCLRFSFGSGEWRDGQAPGPMLA